METSASFLGIFFVLILHSSLGQDIPVHNTCASPSSGTIISFRVNECSAFPCPAKREKPYRADFRFSPAKELKLLRLKCGSMLFGRPQTIRDLNVCEALSEGACPFVPGQNYTYTTTFKLPYWVPGGQYEVACQLGEEDGNNLMCGSGTVKVT